VSPTALDLRCVRTASGSDSSTPYARRRALRFARCTNEYVLPGRFQVCEALPLITRVRRLAHPAVLQKLGLVIAGQLLIGRLLVARLGPSTALKLGSHPSHCSGSWCREKSHWIVWTSAPPWPQPVRPRWYWVAAPFARRPRLRERMQPLESSRMQLSCWGLLMAVSAHAIKRAVSAQRGFTAASPVAIPDPRFKGRVYTCCR